MKKIILVALVVFAVGCKSKEKVVGTQLDRSTEIAIKGDWVLSSVTYEGSEYIKVTSFNIADSKCFEGSNWKFISNRVSIHKSETKFDGFEANKRRKDREFYKNARVSCMRIL